MLADTRHESYDAIYVHVASACRWSEIGDLTAHFRFFFFFAYVMEVNHQTRSQLASALMEKALFLTAVKR